MKHLILERRGTRSPKKRGALVARAASRWRVGLCCLFSAVCISASGQYAIDWHRIDGGGGTSTGGVYSVSGTIGQPDDGTPMTGGPYSLIGGFWSIYAIQTPGAPHLAISLNPQQATAELSWSPDTPGWVLQETLSLSPTSWANSASGSTNPIVVPAASTMIFYRLHKP